MPLLSGPIIRIPIIMDDEEPVQSTTKESQV